jgi:hypothetical protein
MRLVSVADLLGRMVGVRVVGALTVASLGALHMAACAGPAGTNRNSPKYAASSTFHITQLAEVRTDRGRCYAIVFDYATPEKGDLFLLDVGRVPPNGRMNFVSCGERLTLVSEQGGPVLADLPFRNATEFMGDDVVSIPKPADFGEGFQAGTWRRRGDNTFAVHAVTILQTEFDFVHPVTQGTEIRVVTAYKENNQEHTSRAAIMVGYSSAAADPVDFHVWVKAQERRSRTEWRDATGDGAKQLAVATLSRARILLAGER